MKVNLIALKTQETQKELSQVVEPVLERKMAQVGVEFYKKIEFGQLEDFSKGLFASLENCSIILLDLSLKNVDAVLTQIDNFYNTKAQNFSQGKFWIDENTNRKCILYDIDNLDFVKNIDTKFLRKTFADTKYLTILKTYGLDQSEIKKVLNAVKNDYGFEWFITSNFLDCEIDILADADYYNSKPLQDYIRKLYELMGNYVYSDSDDNLYSKLAELLSVRNANLSICDTLTHGLFQYDLFNNLDNYNEKVCGFFNVLKEDDFANVLGMDVNVLNRYVNNSDERIYEAAVSVLDKTKSSIVLVLSGSIEHPCIAIGDNDAIHLYKFNFNHADNFIQNIMIQTSIFKLIKKLKKNDGLF